MKGLPYETLYIFHKISHEDLALYHADCYCNPACRRHRIRNIFPPLCGKRNPAECHTRYNLRCRRISEEYENILKRFVSHTASADSYQLMCDVSVPHTKEYMNLNTSLQSQLSLYTDSSSLIHTAMFSDTKGQLFYSYKSRLRDDTFSPTDTYALSGAPSICIHPATQSPFRGQSDMVVITYLLTVNPSERMVLLADSYENCDAVLYFFLNAQHIQDYLALYYNGSTSDVLLYLTDGSGTPISLSSADDNYAIATDTAIQRGIRYLSGTGNKLLHTGDRYILLVPIANSDLYLANILPEYAVYTRIRSLDLMLLSIALVMFLLIPFLLFFVTRFVTKPLKLLMQSVQEIEIGTYENRLTESLLPTRSVS